MTTLTLPVSYNLKRTSLTITPSRVPMLILCFFTTDVAIPYFNWTIIEAALIIITGSVPYLRPLMATILPEFFKTYNFSTLAFSGRSKGVSARLSTAPSLLDTHGDITITKEFHLEESDAQSDRGFDSRPPGTPMTPLAPRSSPRTVVVCMKSDV